jgi:hypothetical protein
MAQEGDYMAYLDAAEAVDTAVAPALDTETTAGNDEADDNNETETVADVADAPDDAVKPYSERTKYVAVVESDVDEQSGAAAELSRAEIRQVTAELRREAVKNLPHGKYNIMTSETVIAQGSATLIECHEENCVIALGSKIGADYIVRGTISKLETTYTLTVEIYETEDGNLVAQSDPVRADNIRELVENAAPACAAMYRAFVEANTPAPAPAPPPPPVPAATAPAAPESPQKPGIISIGLGGLLAGEYGGGIEWPAGERVNMPATVAGLYLFVDAAYAELSIGYRAGGGKWESKNTVNPQSAPDMTRSHLNIGLSVKYPSKLFPIIGIDYAAATSGKIKYPNKGDEYDFDGANNQPEISALSSLWFKFGGGIDIALSPKIYLRAELLYGLRAANSFEEYCAENAQPGVTAMGGQAVDFKIGVGLKL